MPIPKVISLALGAALFCASLSPLAKASEEDRKTIVTFDQDTQIPGKVLPAGTYVFKLTMDDSSLNIVQIWNEQETQLVSTLFTDEEYTLNTPDSAYFILDTSDHNSPPMLRSWFYPGDNTGRVFLYSKSQPRQPSEKQQELLHH